MRLDESRENSPIFLTHSTVYFWEQNCTQIWAKWKANNKIICRWQLLIHAAIFVVAEGNDFLLVFFLLIDWLTPICSITYVFFFGNRLPFEFRDKLNFSFFFLFLRSPNMDAGWWKRQSKKQIFVTSTSLALSLRNEWEERPCVKTPNQTDRNNNKKECRYTKQISSDDVLWKIKTRWEKKKKRIKDFAIPSLIKVTARIINRQILNDMTN